MGAASQPDDPGDAEDQAGPTPTDDDGGDEPVTMPPEDSNMQEEDAAVLPSDAQPPKQDPRDDAGVPTDSKQEPPPAGVVPMFVAAGQGGRTITSCTDGKTWIANDVLENRSEDHSPYTGKGLAAGHGVFIAVLGWGSPSSVKVSRDGISWKRTTLGLMAGGIGFVGNSFVVPFEGGSIVSSDAGATWTGSKGPRHRPRIAEGMGAAMGSGSDDNTKPYATFDGGASWSLLQGCPDMGFGGIGQDGGFAAGPDRLVVASRTGGICVVKTGAEIVKAQNTTDQLGKPIYAKNRYLIPGTNGIWQSDDGVTFSKRSTTPANLSLLALAHNPHTNTFVGITRTSFHRSVDGVTWQPVAAPSGPNLQRVVFGMAAPSQACPAPEKLPKAD
jgi:hypothetical protein